MRELIIPFIEEDDVNNICLAGGLFGNVRLNQVIRELPSVNHVFVLPCMGDEGLPLAAAVTAQWRVNKTRCRLHTMALGPDFNDVEIKAFLEQQSDLVTNVPEDIEGEIIKLLK